MSNSTYYIKPEYTTRAKNTFFDDSDFKDEWQKEVYEFAEMIFKENNFSSVLDIGTGSGFKLLKHFEHTDTLGMDLPETVAKLKERYPNKKWTDNFSPMLGFDLIIASDVIEHLDDPDDLLNLIKESKPKLIILSTPERELMHGKEHNGPPVTEHHYREWNKQEFYNYLSNSGFKVIKHIITNKKQSTQMILCEYNAL